MCRVSALRVGFATDEVLDCCELAEERGPVQGGGALDLGVDSEARVQQLVDRIEAFADSDRTERPHPLLLFVCVDRRVMTQTSAPGGLGQGVDRRAGNPLERVNKEIKRRTYIVGAFPKLRCPSAP